MTDDQHPHAPFVPVPAHDSANGPKPGEGPDDSPDPEQPHEEWGEDDSDPKEKNPAGNPGNFGIPEQVPISEPDYFSHDAPITEADIPPRPRQGAVMTTVNAIPAQSRTQS